MTGAWSVVIRFACHIPMGIVGFSGRDVYEAVKDIESSGIYDVIPGGRAMLAGLQMNATWGIFAFVWNFVMFLGCIACISWLLVLLGMVDTMVAVTLLVAAARQAQFLPTASSGCDDAKNWRNGTDGRNFFITANATTYSSYGSPKKLCHGMVEVWSCTVAMGVLYLLTGLINLFIGLVQVYGDNPSRSRSNFSRGYRHYNGSYPWGFWAVLGYHALWILNPLLSVLDHPLAACRFTFRYMRKALAARMKAKRDEKAFERRKGAPPAKDAAENDFKAGKQPVLPYELLLKVTKDLHFVDLLSANSSSKRLRMTLFGGAGLDPGQLEHLREFTCGGATKSSCGLCGVQTCPNCQKLEAVWPSMAARHMRGCQPHCSKCFYKIYCRWWGPQGQRLAKHRATCGLREQRTDVEMGVTAGSAPDTKSLCRMCASMTPAERKKRSEARDARELARMEKHPLACSRCKKMLSTGGMRWWICGTCLTECPSNMHPVWGDKNLP